MTLIERLQEATEGSREFDVEIGEFLDIEPSWYDSYGYGDPAKDAPREHAHYSTSIDAALTLVPEGWQGSMDIGMSQGKFEAQLWLDNIREVFGHAHTPALALCAAILKALESGT